MTGQMMVRATSETATEAQAGQAAPRRRAPRKQIDADGKRNVGGKVSVAMARALAILAAKEDRTQLSLIEEAMTDLFAKHNHQV